MSEAVHKDYIGAKFGMWLFLFTEILLFGGLFVLYAVYLNRYPEGFIAGGGELDVRFGAANTLVLLTSSLFVAMSITALRRGEKRLCSLLLVGTILSALIFLINKYFEWSSKISHGIYPGSEHLLEIPKGEAVFFNLYYVMTGLHGLHVLIGMIVLAFTLVFVIRDKVTGEDWVLLENAGLYWHLVDVIWIYLFPLFYLLLH